MKSETKSAETSSGNSLIDAPTWRINDRWVYSGELDVYDFIVDSGVSTNVNTLTGTLDVQVESINLVDVGEFRPSPTPWPEPATTGQTTFSWKVRTATWSSKWIRPPLSV